MNPQDRVKLNKWKQHLQKMVDTGTMTVEQMNNKLLELNELAAPQTSQKDIKQNNKSSIHAKLINLASNLKSYDLKNSLSRFSWSPSKYRDDRDHADKELKNKQIAFESAEKIKNSKNPTLISEFVDSLSLKLRNDVFLKYPELVQFGRESKQKQEEVMQKQDANTQRLLTQKQKQQREKIQPLLKDIAIQIQFVTLATSLTPHYGKIVSQVPHDIEEISELLKFLHNLVIIITPNSYNKEEVAFSATQEKDNSLILSFWKFLEEWQDYEESEKRPLLLTDEFRKDLEGWKNHLKNTIQKLPKGSGVGQERIDTINKGMGESFIAKVAKDTPDLRLAGPSLIRHVKDTGAQIVENDPKVIKQQLLSIHKYLKNKSPSEVLAFSDQIWNLNKLHYEDMEKTLKDKDTTGGLNFVDFDTDMSMFAKKGGLSFWSTLSSLKNPPRKVEFASAESLKNIGLLKEWSRALRQVGITEQQYKDMDSTQKIEKIVELASKHFPIVVKDLSGQPYKLQAQTFYIGQTSPQNLILDTVENSQIEEKINNTSDPDKQARFIFNFTEKMKSTDTYNLFLQNNRIYLARTNQFKKEYPEAKSINPSQKEIKELLKTRKFSLWESDYESISSGGSTIMIHQLYVLEGFVENKDLIHTSFANARKSRQDYVDSISPVEMSIAAKFLNQKLIKLADKTKSTRLLALASKKNLKDFSQILDNPVVSKELTEAHIGLYEGYVKSLNGIVSELDSANTESANYSYGKYSELKRRLAIPYNGALLHELYFEHLKPIKQAAPKDELLQLINNRWGSLEKYFADIKATGLSAGNGWVITAYDPALERLDNYLITEHHIGIPVGLTPILVLDTWEHAYAADYLTKKDEYFDAFLDNLSFDILEERLSLESK